MRSPEKVALRRRMKHQRAAAMSEASGALSAQVCAILRDSALFALATTVAAYLAFADELDLAPLFDEAHKCFVVPRLSEADKGLHFHVLDRFTLVRHRFGQHEPPAAAPEVPPARIDLVLVPGLAFDRTGARLGYGGGYYDRFLAELDPSVPTVGVTLDQLVVAAVPHEGHDVRVSHLLTETGLMAVVSE